MREHGWMLCFVGAAAMGACGDDAGEGASSSAAAGASSSAGSSSDGGSGTSTSAGGSGAEGGGAGAGASGGATGSGGEAGGAGGTTSSSGTGGAPQACPAEPGDTACDGCLKTSCCPELTACALDAVCVCWSDCMKGGDAGKCFGMCGDPSEATGNLGVCGNGQCVSECPQFS
jgi:hypothetical protein